MAVLYIDDVVVIVPSPRPKSLLKDFDSGGRVQDQKDVLLLLGEGWRRVAGPGAACEIRHKTAGQCRPADPPPKLTRSNTAEPKPTPVPRCSSKPSEAICNSSGKRGGGTADAQRS